MSDKMNKFGLSAKAYGAICIAIALILTGIYGYFRFAGRQPVLEDNPFDTPNTVSTQTILHTTEQTEEYDGSQSPEAYLNDGFEIKNMGSDELSLINHDIEGLSKAIQDYLYKTGKSGYTYAVFIELLADEWVLGDSEVLVFQTDVTDEEYILVHYDGSSWYIQQW